MYYASRTGRSSSIPNSFQLLHNLQPTRQRAMAQRDPFSEWGLGHSPGCFRNIWNWKQFIVLLVSITVNWLISLGVVYHECNYIVPSSGTGPQGPFHPRNIRAVSTAPHNIVLLPPGRCSGQCLVLVWDRNPISEDPQTLGLSQLFRCWASYKPFYGHPQGEPWKTAGKGGST